MNKKIVNFFISWREMILSLSIAIVCLGLFFLFPARGAFQDFTRTFFFFGAIPALYTSFVLKKKLRDFGLAFAVDQKSIFWFFAAFIATLLASWLLIQYTPFKEAYSIPNYLLGNFKLFLLYELVFVNIWLFFLEAFFKGFLLFTLEKKFGIWSVLLSAAFLVIFIFISGILSWENASVIVLSLTGGLLAYKTRSFIHSYLMGLLYIIILDAYMIYAIKQYL
jgi:membrane protease YdiL (CAAX protease family)